MADGLTLGGSREELVLNLPAVSSLPQGRMELQCVHLSVYTKGVSVPTCARQVVRVRTKLLSQGSFVTARETD